LIYKYNYKQIRKAMNWKLLNRTSKIRAIRMLFGIYEYGQDKIS